MFENETDVVITKLPKTTVEGLNLYEEGHIEIDDESDGDHADELKEQVFWNVTDVCMSFSRKDNILRHAIDE